MGHMKIIEKAKKAKFKLRDLMDKDQLSKLNFTATYFVGVTDNIYQDCLGKLKRGEKAYTGKNDGTNRRTFLHDSHSLITMTGRRVFSEMSQEELVETSLIHFKIDSKLEWMYHNDAKSINNDLEFFSWKYDSEGVPIAQIYRNKVTGKKKRFKITQSEKLQESANRENDVKSRKSLESDEKMTENSSEKHSKYSQESENGGVDMDESCESPQSEEKITPQDDLKSKSSGVRTSSEESIDESEPSRTGIEEGLGFDFLLCCFYICLHGYFLVYCEKENQEKLLEIKKLKEEKRASLTEVKELENKIQALTRDKKQLEKEKQTSARTFSDLQNQIRALKRKNQSVKHNNECEICFDNPR